MHKFLGEFEIIFIQKYYNFPHSFWSSSEWLLDEISLFQIRDAFLWVRSRQKIL